VESGADADLVRRCLAGEEQAYRELVVRYQRQVFSVARRIVGSVEDAEDLTQETFVRMFRALERYDATRPFSAWLFTIATRLCIDHLRRRRLRPISMVQREPGSDEEYTHDEEEGRVRDLIDSLPYHYRVVVVLRHQQDMSYEEIAEALHLPLGTVKARIHRARALLKQRLELENESS